MLDPPREAFIEATGFLLTNSQVSPKSRSPQSSHAVARYVGIGIAGGDDDAAEFGIDDRLGAGRRAAGVVAGFERDVGGAALDSIAGVLLRFVQGGDFSVVEQVV